MFTFFHPLTRATTRFFAAIGRQISSLLPKDVDLLTYVAAGKYFISHLS
jgi:hypothetical protein